MMNILSRLAPWLLFAFFFIGLCYWGAWQFSKTYNEHLKLEIRKLDDEIMALQDSMLIMEAERKEFNRIKELSFTSPVTPEHVRQEALRAVIDNERDRENWLRFKTKYLEIQTKYRNELNESIIRAFD